MSEPDRDEKGTEFASLEHTDLAESRRQLWWTIGVTMIGIAVIAYFTL
jgi:hypothetical protein